MARSPPRFARDSGFWLASLSRRAFGEPHCLGQTGWQKCSKLVCPTHPPTLRVTWRVLLTLLLKKGVHQRREQAVATQREELASGASLDAPGFASFSMWLQEKRQQSFPSDRGERALSADAFSPAFRGWRAHQRHCAFFGTQKSLARVPERSRSSGTGRDDFGIEDHPRTICTRGRPRSVL